MDMSLCTLSGSTVNVNDSPKNVLPKPQRPQRGLCKLCARWYLHRYIDPGLARRPRAPWRGPCPDSFTLHTQLYLNIIIRARGPSRCQAQAQTGPPPRDRTGASAYCTAPPCGLDRRCWCWRGGGGGADARASPPLLQYGLAAAGGARRAALPAPLLQDGTRPEGLARLCPPLIKDAASSARARACARNRRNPASSSGSIPARTPATRAR